MWQENVPLVRRSIGAFNGDGPAGAAASGRGSWPARGGKYAEKVMRSAVARADRGQVIEVLDGGQDRRRVVLGVIDREVTAEQRRDDDRGNPGPRSPLVVRARWAAGLTWWRDVVPAAAVLVVGEHDQRAPGARAVL